MKQSALLRSSLCIAALAASFFAVSAHAQIVNGGFETGDFTGWTVNDPTNFTLIGNDTAFGNNHTQYYANLGAYDYGTPSTLGELSQTITTTPGDVFNVSFALSNDGFTLNQFNVLWDGAVVFSMTNLPQAIGYAYTTYSISNLVATGSTAKLTFQYNNESDFFRLDDVTASAVPEPSTISFAALGLGILGLTWYGRAKARRA